MSEHRVTDPIRDGIQRHLDACGDGWTVRDYIVCVGIERILSDGGIETSDYWIAPDDQPEYATDGLLRATWDARSQTECEP